MWRQISHLHDLQQGFPSFEQQMAVFLRQLQISPADYLADHISVRCNHLATAQRWQAGFSQCADVLSNKSINGRPIYLFALSQPLLLMDWQIDCVELPYPTHKQYPNEGWEHIELVLPCPVEQLEQQVLARLPPLEALRAQRFKVKLSQPKGSNEGLANPTLAISNGVITVKFHPYSIREVILSENK